MATNLTTQVRGIAKVVTAVANGDLHQKLTVEAKGEIAALADTINGMTDTLAIFADQVTTVAREVGVEGRLGGQANVPGTAGIWKDLTANVNQLAANLTTQVRAIAEVATAVTQGDLTRSIQVDVRGEVADLKDNINAMIGTLRATTETQPRAGLAEDQPRQVQRHDAGPARPDHAGPHAAVGTGAAGQRAAGRDVRRRDRRRPRPRLLRQLAGYADAAGAARPRTLRVRRRPDRPVRRAGPADPARRRARRARCRSSPGLLSAAPAQRDRAAGAVRGPGQGGDRAGLAVASSPPSQRAFLEQLSGSHRHRAQHHRGDDAHRDACCRSRSSSPASCSRSRTSCSRPTRRSRSRPRCWPSRTPRWSARTRRSSTPAARWRKRPRSWR